MDVCISASHLCPSAAYNMHRVLASDVGCMQGGQPDRLSHILEAGFRFLQITKGTLRLKTSHVASMLRLDT
jgi:hypothetical protein